MQIKINGAKVGFGVTLMPKNPGDPVLKYYFEPEISLEVSEVTDKENLQASIDALAEELLGMVQETVRKRVRADKERTQQARMPVHENSTEA